MSNSNTHEDALLNMHKALLEALRHREQEIFKYLSILGPALGGFIWLLAYNGKNRADVFTYGTLGVLLLLLLGALYSLALGYNYRYITLQIAKLEHDPCLEIHDRMLVSWPRSPQDFARRYRLGVLPWCTPPEIIKIFWAAFLVGIAGVTYAAFQTGINVHITVPVGGVCMGISVLGPIWFGIKIQRACKKEPLQW